MRDKWYIEFPLVLLAVLVAIFAMWNVNPSSCNFSLVAPKGRLPESDSTFAFSPENVRWLEGKRLFKANCAACHNPKADGVGPALKGVTARWKAAGTYQGKTGEQWMRVWIHNYEDVVNAKYKYGVDMANSRPPKMNMFPYLSDEEIDKILLYVESPDGPAQPVVAKK